MNENPNLMATALLALNQFQTIKDRIDPEVFNLLNTSGHEAIASAHHFLDACEKALDSLVSSQGEEVSLVENEDEVSFDDASNNVVTFNREA
ncbi:MAG TPA: hypothetical protein PKB15_08320 [Acidimicrobiia bacterium]|nr:hypothetical protein [Acidimicrobiia bacterium]